MTEMLHHWVTAKANLRPDALAVALDDERLTYGEIETLSNQLARALKERGCVRDDRICLLLPKSPLAVVCLLGIYKADCIYVPLDTTAPATQLAQIILAAGSRCLLAAASLAPRVREILSQPDLPALRIGWLGMPDQSAGPLPTAFRFSDIGALLGTPLHGAHRAHDIAHILFRHDRGGAPRGVMATHGNVVGFVEWAKKYLRMSAADRIAGHANLDHSLSLFDIFGSFSSGAELHLVPGEVRLLPGRITAWIRASGITHWCSDSVVLDNIAKFDAVQPWDFPELRRVLWNGVPLSTPALSYWMRQLPHVEFTNLYGTAEAAVACGYHTITSFPEDEAEQIPLGRACGGAELLLLDNNLQPAATGSVGEIYVRGSTLSPGYWREPGATSRTFPELAGVGRVYRSGDRGVRGHDGLIYIADRGGVSTLSDGASVGSDRLHEAPSATESSPVRMVSRRWRAWEELTNRASSPLD